MKTNIKLGFITITNPLSCLFWILVCIGIFYCFAGTVMFGAR